MVVEAIHGCVCSCSADLEGGAGAVEQQEPVTHEDFTSGRPLLYVPLSVFTSVIAS